MSENVSFMLLGPAWAPKRRPDFAKLDDASRAMAGDLLDRISGLAPALAPGPYVMPEGARAVQGVPPINAPVAAATYDVELAQHVLAAVGRFRRHSPGNDGNIARLLRYSMQLPRTAPRTDVGKLTAMTLEYAWNLVDSAQQHVEMKRGGPDAHRNDQYVPPGHPRAHGFDLLDPEAKAEMLEAQEAYNSSAVALAMEIGFGSRPTVVRAAFADFDKSAWRIDGIAGGTHPYSEDAAQVIKSSSWAGTLHRAYRDPTTDAHRPQGIGLGLVVPAV